MPRKRRQSRTSFSAATASTPTSGAAGDDTPPSDQAVAVVDSADSSQPISSQWTTLRENILVDHSSNPPRSIYGEPARGGTLYRWGLATAIGGPIDSETNWLTRLAVDAPVTAKRYRGVETEAMIRRLHDALQRSTSSVADASVTLCWAAAMPRLMDRLGEHDWWDVLGTLQEFRDGILHRDPAHPCVLVGGVELGLTLAWTLRSLPSCRRLVASSIDALTLWCRQDELSISAVLERPDDIRCVLASVLRLRRLLPVIRSEMEPKSKGKKKQRKAIDHQLEQLDEIGIELATWAAALTRQDGVQTLTRLGRRDVRDDLGDHGLLMQAADLDRETLTPTIHAAIGRSRTKGRLAWQISLPEAMLHDEEARLACLLPEWDVRRGATTVDYRDTNVRLELSAGKQPVVSGTCESSIVVDGNRLEPSAPWIASCEYTDDDVHYLELEQTYSAGFVLQRQIMLFREERCCVFADAVVRSRFESTGAAEHVPVDERASATPLPNIEYQVRLPLADATHVRRCAETTEVFLEHLKQGALAPDGLKPRAMVLPLSSNEWRQTDSTARMSVADDGHLLLSARGQGQLFAPLWIDLTRKRFHSKRTWRQLTVAHQLEIVPDRDAVAYRIQIGPNQWILYRSLSIPQPRTFFGRQLIADFYCARFDSDEQSYEDLITVEDSDH